MAALRTSVLAPSQSAAISSPKRFHRGKFNVFLYAKNSLSSNSENPNSSSSEEKEAEKTLKKSSQSSWDAKNSEGKDYLYRLGQEADNLNVTVGARKGLIDDLFVGNFLGKDADIVFDYRHKVTRSFEHLQGDYYIAPAFMEKIVLHIVKNYMAHLMDIKIPLILGVWGGKGQGKSFQTELIFRAMGIEPIIMSAGELESERAGEPGKLIRERYRMASQVIKNQGKMSCLMINDLDAGVGRFANTQVTVNNQIVMGTLMNLADNPTRVSIGQDWRESDITNRVPIIVTGNDFSTLYAPLIRDGRMDKFYWQPTREDLINIVHRMYQNDGISKDKVVRIVDTFPNQALDFYGALRSRTYDRFVLKWVEYIGGAEKLGEKLLRRRKDDALPPFTPPKSTEFVSPPVVPVNENMNVTSPMQPIESIPQLVIPVNGNTIDSLIEAEDDGFELEGTFPFMEDLDDINPDYSDHDIVLAPPRKCGIAQTMSSKTKPDCGASRRKKGQKLEAEKLHIEGKEAVEEGSQWTMDTLLSRNKKRA